MPIEKLLQRPVHSLSQDVSCAEAATVMRDAGIGTVVVADAGRPLGIVTDRDLAVRVMAAGLDPRTVALRDVMTRTPVFLSKTRNVNELIDTMRDMGVRRVPVVDEDGQLIGIISMDDLFVLLSDQLHALADVVRTALSPAPAGVAES